MRQKECSMNDTSLSQVCCWCTHLRRFKKEKWSLGQVTTPYFQDSIALKLIVYYNSMPHGLEMMK